MTKKTFLSLILVFLVLFTFSGCSFINSYFINDYESFDYADSMVIQESQDGNPEIRLFYVKVDKLCIQVKTDKRISLKTRYKFEQLLNDYSQPESEMYIFIHNYMNKQELENCTVIFRVVDEQDRVKLNREVVYKNENIFLSEDESVSAEKHENEGPVIAESDEAPYYYAKIVLIDATTILVQYDSYINISDEGFEKLGNECFGTLDNEDENPFAKYAKTYMELNNIDSCTIIVRINDKDGHTRFEQSKNFRINKDYPATINVNGINYYSTNAAVPVEVDDSVIKYTTSYAENGVPTKDGEANFNRDTGTPYAVLEDGMVVVMIDNEWIEFKAK